MFSNALVIAVIAAIFLGAICIIVHRLKKQGIEDIYSIIFAELSKAFKKAMELNIAEADGYESVHEFVINEIYTLIQESKMMDSAIKEIFTKEKLESLLDSYIKSLWNYKLEDPNKNMSEVALLKSKPV